MAADLLRALAHSGGAVHVAYHVADGPDRTRPVGAAVAVFGPPRSHAAYSLIAAAAEPGGGVGYALKQAQRAWALRRGATSLTWTFDPLIGRNARFNLVKLGAIATEYVVDFYGPLADGTNDGDETDRLAVTWEGQHAHDRRRERQVRQGGRPARTTTATPRSGSSA